MAAAASREIGSRMSTPEHSAAKSGCSALKLMPIGLQVARRPVDRAPHVRGRAVVEAQAFFRLLEMPADDVRELFELDIQVRIEGVEVIHRHETRRAVPLVLAGVLILALDVGRRLEVLAEETLVRF